MTWVPFYLLPLLFNTGQSGPGTRGPPNPSLQHSPEGHLPSVSAVSQPLHFCLQVSVLCLC